MIHALRAWPANCTLPCFAGAMKDACDTTFLNALLEECRTSLA